MFLGYSLDRWIGLLQYCCIVFALSAGVCFISAKATYVCFGKKNKRISNKIKVKNKTVKKQIFFDVA